jgi:hypothetical protein
MQRLLQLKTGTKLADECREWLAKKYGARLAKEYRVDRRTISALRTGAHAMPELPLALALEPHGIPQDAWLKSPESIATAVDTGSGKVTSLPPPERAA